MQKRDTPQKTDYYLFNAFANLKAHYNDKEKQHLYCQYDAGGERMYKVVLSDVVSRTNALGSGILEIEKIAYYPSGYINIDQHGNYTKHYYADDQRIASKIGSGFSEPINTGIVDTTHLSSIMKNELGVLLVTDST